MNFKKNIQRKWINCLQFLCGTESDAKINRSVLWTMISTISTLILLIIAYYQLKGINETTSAEFSHKIKNDLYTDRKMRLIEFFDNNILLFKSDSNDHVWFEVDTVGYRNLPSKDFYNIAILKHNVFEIDELLQDFEDLSFYNKKGQISIDYIYDQYAYYIEMLWENPQIRKYIQWQRDQPHNSNSYVNLESIYTVLKSMTDGER